MALTVGTDTYISQAEADAYHVSMGNTGWSTTSTPDVIALKEASLRKATAFLDSMARGKWKGRKATADQALAWPRTGVIDEEGYEVSESDIPTAVAVAACEAALRYYVGDDLMPDSANNVASESVAGAVSVSYFEGKETTPVYNKIYKLLEGLIDIPIGGNKSTVMMSSAGYAENVRL